MFDLALEGDRDRGAGNRHLRSDEMRKEFPSALHSDEMIDGVAGVQKHDLSAGRGVHGTDSESVVELF
jgi:hypothetical protein